MMALPFAALRRSFASRLTVGIGGLLALGLSLTQTVINAMPAATLPAAEVGQPLETGRWRIVVLGASLGTGKRPDGYRGRPGTKALSVDLDLANRTSESSNVVSRVLKVDPPIPGLSPLPTTYLMRDGAILGALQPGLPERVRMVWEVPDSATVPDTLRLVVTGETFKPRDNLFAAPGWFNAKPIAAVSLPVKPEPEGAGS